MQLNLAPIVSIIIPTYNSSEYILIAIRSIQDQIYDNIEIIVVDDGSTDDTKAKLNQYIENDDIRYIYQDNKGASAARNKGITLAKGEYIGFLDADDKFDESMVSCCVSELVSNDYDLVSVDNYKIFLSGNVEIGREDQEYAWIEKEANELFLAFLKTGGIGGVHKAIFKKCVFNKVGYLDESLVVYEDLDLWIRIAMKGLKWGHIRKQLVYCYRRDSNNSLFTQNVEINQDCRVLILKKYKAEAIKRSLVMKSILAGQLWDFGRAYVLEYKNIPKALKCFVSSIIIQPNIRQVIKSCASYFHKHKNE
mgnify:CR=1 FL=1